MYLNQNSNWQSRTELLLGQKSVDKLKKSHVLVVGLGGVGAYSAEMLARAGVGELTIVDGDTVKPSNRNRQLLALQSTENKLKAELMKERLIDINPEIKINVINQFLNEEDMRELMEVKYDYVIDAIDTVTPKVSLIVNAVRKNYKLISSMGAGGRLNPSDIKIVDISETHTCHLARVIRKRLYKHGINRGFDVIFSSETVNKKAVILIEDEINKVSTVGTVSYMPALFGIMAASKVIRKLTGEA